MGVLKLIWSDLRACSLDRPGCASYGVASSGFFCVGSFSFVSVLNFYLLNCVKSLSRHAGY